MTIKRLFILLLILFALLLFPIIFVFSPDISNYTHRTKFDRETWINWEETDSTACVRWDMVHGLINKYDLKGKTEKDVLNLLGEPESKNISQYRYYLGMSRHGIDTGSLILTFKNGIIVDIEIWHG